MLCHVLFPTVRIMNETDLVGQLVPVDFVIFEDNNREFGYNSTTANVCIISIFVAVII